MKKLSILFLSIALITTTILNFSGEKVKAEGLEQNKEENLAKIKEIQKDIINLLDSSNVEDNASVEKALDDYFKQHPENQEIFDQYYQENSGELLPNVDEDSEDDIDLNNYLEENVENGEFQEYQPTDDTKIIFTDTPTFFMESVEEKPVPVDPSDSLITTLAATKKTKSTSNQSYVYTAKNIYGITTLSIGIEGYFTYNGTSSTGHVVDGWYRRGAVTLWQVSGFTKKATSLGSGKSRIYSAGQFYVGLQIKGHGVTATDKYINVHQDCDKNGNRKFSRTVREN
ncbi:hypothetical protein COJ21_24380 [Priestia megaterium]|uniref:hypothetical protein n=1 Tax=Priestia megaterium TaxID=1404 RepID=UPI000BF8BCDA|nr:hypothetical protein [Priestia megaterium]PFK67056.1 hypothetical protein COJ21_24380 [Priestia megaterium]